MATVVFGLALAVFVVGLSLFVLTQPFFTRVLAERLSLADEAGLPRERMLAVAEQVRAYVVDGVGATLPEWVDGRPGFDASAVSHLSDVRDVIAAASVATWSLAIVLALWFGIQVASGRLDRVAQTMYAGALSCVVFVVLAFVAGLFDFDALFSAFHGLFFAEGTWTFASDSLLIQTFPESFWATAAGVWGALVLLGAAALGLGARTLSASGAQTSPDAE